MIDLHIHSQLSHDGKAKIKNYCEQAQKLDIKEIGFCEHLDLFPNDPHFGLHNYRIYQEEIERARQQYPNLKIRMGVEVTYLPEIEKEIAEYLENKDYDYILGAVHLVDDGNNTISEQEPAQLYFSRKSAEECYQGYFELALKSVKSGLFDGIAHLDLINRYGLNYFPDWEWRFHYGIIRRIFEGIIKRGMALEVNSSGLRELPKRAYPEKDLVKLYQELGGEIITIGSDAHSVEFLGAGLEELIQGLKALGVSRLASFERRNVQWIELGEK